MKKTLLIFIGIFFFSCGNRDNTADDANRDATTIDEDVEIGAGEEISPQLRPDTGGTFDVDTITTPRDTTRRQR